MSAYNSHFYRSYSAESEKSAELVLGEIFKHYQPTTMADIGCGIGTWLSAAQKLGVKQVLGVDGDYVKSDELLISRNSFHPQDLSKPVDMSVYGRFDLAISVEVGEHLPESSADVLVDVLTTLSDVVFFSAAIPGQGGTDHINEQWPVWWAERFAAKGYKALDLIRQPLWDDPAVAYYYVQNGLLYVKANKLAELPHLQQYEIPFNHWSMRAVNFRKWNDSRNPDLATFRFVLKAMPGAFTRAVKLRVARLFGKGF